MNTVLVTGVAGFIGMHCALKLLDEGAQVVGGALGFLTNLGESFRDRLMGCLSGAVADSLGDLLEGHAEFAKLYRFGAHLGRSHATRACWAVGTALHR